LGVGVAGVQKFFVDRDGNGYFAGNVGIGTSSPKTILNLKGKSFSTLTGTVAIGTGQALVTGTGTLFTSELEEGDAIKIGTETFGVASITDDTHLYISGRYLGETASGLTAYFDSADLFVADDGEDNERFKITSGGELQVASRGKFGSKNSNGYLNLYFWTQSNYANGLNTYKRGNPSDIDGAALTGAELGYHNFYGWDGSAYGRGAFAIAKTTEDWTAAGHGTSYNIYTTPSGSTANTSRLFIGDDGSIGIGGISTKLSRLTAKAPAGFNASGTVATSAGSAIVAGTSSYFTTQVGIGDNITVGGETKTVVSIASNSSLTVDSVFSNDNAGAAMAVAKSIFRLDNSANAVKFIVSNSGNVGIGTTSPAELLDVNGRLRLAQTTAPETIADKLYNVSGNLVWNGVNLTAGGALPSGAEGQLLYNNNGAWTAFSGMYWDDTNSRLGIGTTSPGYALDVNGGFRVGNATSTAGIVFDPSTGNVGIGTTEPSSKLNVLGITTLQSGSATGGILIGADLNTTTLSANVRKLGRIAIPSYDNTYNISVLSADSRDASRDELYFGGTVGGSLPAPTLISFVTTPTIGVAAGNAERMRINSAGNVGIGTTSPGYTLDVNGGFRVGNATSTAGIVFDPSTGNVGIGTTAPSVKLDVAGTISSNAYIVTNDLVMSGTNRGVYMTNFNRAKYSFGSATATGAYPLTLSSGNAATHTDGYITLSTAGNERVRVDSTGNVGIGTTSPAELLDVNGRLRLAQTTAPETIADKLYNVSGNLVWNGVNLTAGGALPSGAEGQLLYNNAGAWTAFDGMYWDDTNSRLGIGTTTPNYKFNVAGANSSTDIGDASLLGIVNTDTTANNTIGLAFGQANLSGAVQTVAGIDLVGVSHADGAQSGALAFSTRNAGSWAERLRIDPSGNVGIGTAAPNSYPGAPLSLLHVNGQNQVTDSWGTALLTSNGAMGINKGGSLTMGGSYFGTTLAGFGAIAGRKENSTSGNPAGYLQLSYGNSSGSLVEGMRIDSTGNVGIGTTSPSSRLHVVGADTSTSTVAQIGGSSGTGLVVLNNGNVGVGTTAPQRPFHAVLTSGTIPTLGSQVGIFQSNATADSNSIFAILAGEGSSAGTAGVAGIQFGDKDVIARGNIFYYNLDDRMYLGTAGSLSSGVTINSAGNVGIGTTSPVELLDVNGRLRLAQTTAPETIADKLYNVSGNLVWNGVNLTAGGALPSGAEGQLLYNNAGAWTAFSGLHWDDTNSRLGIGTTSPGYALDVSGTTNSSNYRVNGNYVLSASGSAIAVGTTAAKDLSLYAGAADRLYIQNSSGNVGISTASPGYTLDVNGGFRAGNATSTAGIVFDPSTGNVGIGTASPAEKLDVAGNMAISGNIVPSADDTYSLGSPTNFWESIYVGPGSIYVDGQKVLQTDLADSVVVSADIDQNLILQTTGDGDIELNPTPSGGGQIRLKGNIILTGEKTFRTTDNSPVILSDGISTPSITTTVLNGGIAITPNGTGNTYVTAGYFGVGTTSPAELLDVNGRLRLAQTTAPADIANKLYNVSGNLVWNGVNLTAGGTLPVGTEGQLLYNNNGAWTAFNGMYWDDENSRLGIGTTTPSQALDVAGTIRTTGSVYTNSGSGVLTNLKVGNLAANGYFSLVSNNTEQVRIDSSGNVGIGTTSPGYTLDVNGTFNASATSTFAGRVGIGTTTPVTALQVVGDVRVGGSTNKVYYNTVNTYIGSDVNNELTAQGYNKLSLKTHSSATDGYISFLPKGVEQVRIDSTGNVGIGTIAPGYTLDVNGGFRVGNATSTAGIVFDPSTGNVGIGTTAPGYTLDVNGTFNASATSTFAGRVGIGTTAPTRELDVVGAIMASAAVYATGGGAYLNSSGVMGIGSNGFQVGSTYASGDFKLYAGNTEWMRISSTGNVGIGTTGPLGRLDSHATVTSGASGSSIVASDDTAYAAGVGGMITFTGKYTSGGSFLDGAPYIRGYKVNATDGDYSFGLKFGTRNNGESAATRMTIDNLGNVGIGTTSPAELLDVNGRLRLAQTTAPETIADKLYNVSGNLVWNGVNLTAGGALPSGAEGQLLYNNAGAWTAFSGLHWDDTNSRLGIGTTSPEYTLQVGTGFAAGATGSINVVGAITAKTSSLGGFAGAQLLTGQLQLGSGSALADVIIARQSNGDLSFSASSTEAMRISSAGNVGIGTTSPGNPLEVVRGAAGAETTILQLRSNFATANTATTLKFTNSATTGAGYGSSELTSLRESGGGTVFMLKTGKTDGSMSERLRIDNSGNVGIGTTSPAEMLDVNGRLRLAQTTAPETIVDRLYNVSGNLVWNGVNLTAGGALPSGAEGQLLYNNAGAWTAFSGLYWDDTNSRLGIGTTEPLGQLHVVNNGTTAQIGVDTYSNIASAGSQFFFRRYGGTVSEPLALSTGDRMGFFGWGGWDGTALANNAGIFGYAAESFTTSAHGVYIGFETTALGSTSRTEKLRLNSTGGLSLGNGYVGTDPGAGSMIIQGNVGIGITSPAATLHVAAPSTTAASLTWGATAGTIFRSEGSELAMGLLNASPYPYWIQARTSGNTTRDIALQPLGGNVGIGTTTPGSTLHVNNTAVTDTTLLTLESDINNVGEYNQLLFKVVNGFSYGAIRNYISASGKGSLAFFGGGDSGITSEIVRMDGSTGNVGIGTTSPAELLDVNGRLRLAQTTAPATTTDKLYNVSGNLVWNGVNLTAGGALPSGAEGQLLYNNAGAWTAFDGMYWDNATNRLGIGTTAPGDKLDVAAGNLDLDNTTNTNQFGMITKNGAIFLHNFEYGNNGIVTPSGDNLFLGSGAGNLTTGSTASNVNQSSFLVGIGSSSLRDNTTGYNNIAVGRYSLRYNTSGYYNTALGTNSLLNNTTGAYNSAFGNNAGRYISDGSDNNKTSGYSIYLGTNTKALADGDTNEIVIGYNATGAGSDSVVLGNDSITKTILKGNIGIGTTTPAELLDVNGRLRLAQTTAPETIVDRLYNVSGNLVWNGVNLTAGGALPSGAEGQLLYNNAGAWTAFDGMYWDDTNSRLGIGTTTPNYKFNVAGANSSTDIGDASLLGIVNTDTTANNTIGLAFGQANLSGAVQTVAGIDLVGVSHADGAQSGALAFATRNAGSWDERLRIDSSGNVGIGTTSPVQKLDVVGTIYSRAATTIGQTVEQIRMGRSDSDVRYNSIYSNGLQGGGGAANNMQFRVHDGGVAPFTGQTTVMTLLGNGNVGIGTTSPAAGYKLDVAGNINSAQTVNQETYPSINASQTASDLQDGSAFTGTDATMATMYQAVQFTASDAHTMGDFTVRVKESADITNTTATLTGYIYADDGGSPSKPTGAALATGNSVKFGTLTTSYQILSMGTSYTMVSGTKYWLVLKYSAAPTGGNIILDSDASSNMGATSADGASWTNTDVRLRYVIRGRTYYAGNFFSTNSYGVRGGSTNSFGVYGNSTNSYGIYGSSTNNYGIYGLSANNVGVYGGSTNGYGVYGNSTNSFGVYGGSTNGIAGYLSINPATTDTVAEVLRLRRQTSGTAADGIGGLINFYAEDSAGTDELTGRIGNLLTTATSGSETSALTFWTRTGGAAIAERLRIDGAGNVGIGTLAGEGNRAVYSDADGVLTNSSSDIRLKINIGSIADEMDVIGNLSKLRGIYYNWDTSLDAAKNLGAQREIGMIAQEVQAVMPELVGQNASGYLSLDYPKFTAYLLEVAKAQQSRIDNISLQLTEQGLINSTTTVDSAEESENSLLAKVRNILESLGLAIYDGAASLRRVVVETFSAKTARVEQLEMVDKATGEVYCTWIENGVWEKTEGACGDEPAQNTGSSESPETGSAAGNLENNNGQSSNEGDPAPAGDSVENTGSSDSADDEEGAAEDENDKSDAASEAAQETIDPAADGEELEEEETADDTVSEEVSGEEVSGEEVSEEEISESVGGSEDVSESGESL